VEVTRFDHANCTQEIPVLYNGTQRYADPYTWVLGNYPTVVPCSDVAQVRWKFGSDWYCANPRVTRCEAPGKLNVTFGVDLETADFTEGWGSSAYTPDQLEQHRRFQMAQGSREAMVSKITNAGVQFTGASGGLGLPIDQDDLVILSLSVGALIMPLVYILGEWTTYFIGFCMIFTIIKLIAGCSARMYILYRERGCGWWILAALWHTTFVIVRIPLELAKEAMNLLRRDVEDVPLGEARAHPEGQHQLRALGRDDTEQHELAGWPRPGGRWAEEPDHQRAGAPPARPPPPRQEGTAPPYGDLAQRVQLYRVAADEEPEEPALRFVP